MVEGSDRDSVRLSQRAGAAESHVLQFERDASVTRIAMFVPLLDGAADCARALAAAGPPVDPATWAIEEYQIFVTDREVTLVFETCDDGLFERLAGGPSLWPVAAEWMEIAAGAPHVVPADNSWSRPRDETTGLLFNPTPGPGDSEGGDVFAP